MKTIELKINSMKCLGCVNTVKFNLAKLKGVDSVETYLDTKTVTIMYNGSDDVLHEIYSTLDFIGFPAER